MFKPYEIFSLIFYLLELIFILDNCIDAFMIKASSKKLFTVVFYLMIHLLLSVLLFYRMISFHFFIAYLYPVIMLVILIYGRDQLKKWKKGNISRHSIKQFFDELPIAIFFYNTEGLPLLTNDTLNHFLGNPINNGNNFSHYLKDHDYMIDYRGRTFLFNQTQIDDQFIQIIGIDITESNKLTKQLEIENEQLYLMNSMLKEYSKQIDQIIKDEELLEAKIRIHDDLGRILLTTKYFLTNPDSTMEIEELRRLWKENNQGFLHHQRMSKSNPYHELEKAASFIDMKIELEGSDPFDQELFITGCRECLTNAKKHGNAKVLHVRIEKDSIVFSNDGTPPSLPIIEKGGLLSLHKMVEKKKAIMEIRNEPSFTLTIRKG